MPSTDHKASSLTWVAQLIKTHLLAVIKLPVELSTQWNPWIVRPRAASLTWRKTFKRSNQSATRLSRSKRLLVIWGISRRRMRNISASRRKHSKPKPAAARTSIPSSYSCRNGNISSQCSSSASWRTKICKAMTKRPISTSNSLRTILTGPKLSSGLTHLRSKKVRIKATPQREVRKAQRRSTIVDRMLWKTSEWMFCETLTSL